jgi:hypothetical protein
MCAIIFTIDPANTITHQRSHIHSTAENDQTTTPTTISICHGLSLSILENHILPQQQPS